MTVGITSGLLFDLARLFRKESEALTYPYAWPPKVTTAEETKESMRLLVTSWSISYRAVLAKYTEETS